MIGQRCRHAGSDDGRDISIRLERVVRRLAVVVPGCGCHWRHRVRRERWRHVRMDGGQYTRNAQTMRDTATLLSVHLKQYKLLAVVIISE